VTTPPMPIQSPAEQVRAAIVAHELWKQRLQVVIDSGHSEVHIRTVHRDDLCALGKWLNDEAHQVPESGLRLQAVRDLHAACHRSAAEVLALAVNRERAAANAALGEGSEYQRCSDALLQQLADWHRSLASTPGAGG
jgi:Chemoreceptor zinc-binding domain